MPIAVGGVALHMGPRDLGAPDDLEQAIVDFIDGAGRRLDVAVQELDNRRIAEAIVRARQRKVQVRLVLEAMYLAEERAVADPWAAAGAYEENRAIQNAVLRSAIYVRSDFNPATFHQKFMVRDGGAVLTGSANFTTTDCHRNLNHVVVVDSRKLANIYAAEFAEIAQGHFGALNEGHDPAPPVVEAGGVPIWCVFAPDHNPEMEIMKQMLKARERIDFAVFTFAKSSGIDDAMIARSEAGIPIRGALDRRQANQKWAATRPVRNAGAELYLVGGEGAVRKLHHKLMVLDGRVVVAGSFNYTGPATRLNDENVLVIGDIAATGAQLTRQRRLAGYALTEIDRIIETHGERIP